MAGFEKISIYAEPSQMLDSARDLAGVAAKLGPADIRHRAVSLAPGAFARTPNSAAAQQSWQQAAAALASYLGAAVTAIESMSEGVHRSSQDYRSADARVSEMYRRLLLSRPDDAAAGPGPDSALTGPAGIPPRGTDPDAVHDWWRALTADQRNQVAADRPELVGALDGVPAEDRDKANRILLDREIAHQRDLLDRYETELRRYGDGTGNVVLDKFKATQRLAALDAIHQRLDNPVAGHQAYLIGLSAAGDGQAIVAVGNPDQARQVLTYVPGMGSDLTTVPEQVGRMDAIADQAPADSSAIVWLGYDAPDVGPQVALQGYASDAAVPLNRFQDGLRVTHEGLDPSRNVLLAHSYGTTAYGLTATQYGVSADSVYLLGSIGTTQDSAQAFLGTPTDQVYVTTTENDIAHYPPYVDWYGDDPSHPSFGAHLVPDDYLAGMVKSHTEYLYRPEIIKNITDLLAGRRP